MHLHINTYGAYLHVKDDMFEVRLKQDGQEQKHHLAAHKVKTITLATSAALSTDAIRLALINNIDVIFLEYDGKPLGRVWHSKLGSTTRIRKLQLIASLNALGLSLVKEWLCQKMEQQAGMLQALAKHRPKLQEYLKEKQQRIAALEGGIRALEAATTAEVAETIRGLEGTAGRLYFEALSKCLPERWQFRGRSSRPAADAFNAFLNYAYGVLYSRVERVLILAGLDPYVGFLHRDDYNQLSFVFDFIEPYRPWMDDVVFKLFSAKKVNDGHLDAIKNGMSLNTEGKRVLMEALNKFMEEDTIRYKSRNLIRSHAMQLDAHAVAQRLLAEGTLSNDASNDIISSL